MFTSKQNWLNNVGFPGLVPSGQWCNYVKQSLWSNKRNLQQVQSCQGNLSLLSVQADQQYHAVQQYPEVQAHQHYPAGGNREK